MTSREERDEQKKADNRFARRAFGAVLLTGAAAFTGGVRTPHPGHDKTPEQAAAEAVAQEPGADQLSPAQVNLHMVDATVAEETKRREETDQWNHTAHINEGKAAGGTAAAIAAALAAEAALKKRKRKREEQGDGMPDPYRAR